jgi:hypothetical protein
MEAINLTSATNDHEAGRLLAKAEAAASFAPLICGSTRVASQPCAGVHIRMLVAVRAHAPRRPGVMRRAAGQGPHPNSRMHPLETSHTGRP